MESIEEILDTSKWIDPPTEKGTERLKESLFRKIMDGCTLG